MGRLRHLAVVRECHSLASLVEEQLNTFGQKTYFSTSNLEASAKKSMECLTEAVYRGAVSIGHEYGVKKWNEMWLSTISTYEIRSVRSYHAMDRSLLWMK